MFNSEQRGSREPGSSPKMTGEVGGTNVAPAKDAHRSPGQALHLCGKKRQMLVQ